MDSGYFYDNKGKLISVIFDELSSDLYIWAVSFKSENTFQLTKTGDQFKILATVIAIIREWASQAKPALLTFSSNKEDGSRSKTYQAMVNRLAPTIGYVDVTNNIALLRDQNKQQWVNKVRRAHSNSDIFVLARTDQLLK